MMLNLFFLLPVLFIILDALPVCGYTPAQPSNYTDPTADQVSTPRLLQLYANGSDWEDVTLRSAGSNAGNHPVQGIFVHFSEDLAGTESTNTPWIALVACDANSTNSFSGADIFTMAKDRGAKSAILHSVYSETCVINPGYQGGLDIFTIQTLNASRRIKHELSQSGPSNEAYYGHFNARALNSAASRINTSITFSYPTTSGFLLATLVTRNASSNGSQNDANGTTNGTIPSVSTNGSSHDTGVAMIILYAITGCVSALFCGVIVSGAIRAIRHPERYGPRRADSTLGGGQTRAGGLGRAILDTFPIVKFGNNRESDISHPKDIESARLDIDPNTSAPPPGSVQLLDLEQVTERGEPQQDPVEGPLATTSQEAREDNQASEEADQIDLLPQRNSAARGSSRAPASSFNVVPECIGRETCPICIVDFEEGDDLRVLPCEGNHRFHQSCVDPWLLQLSASCPICRQDFRALETIISGELESEASPNRNSVSSASTQQNRRFSRYLRFALVRQRRVDGGDGGSPPPPAS